MIRKILISQPSSSADRTYKTIAEEFGVQIDFRQLIRVEGLTPKEFRAQHINPLDYSAIILNSRLGIEHFFRLCYEMRLTVPDSMHYYCISEAVGNYLQKFIQYRKRKVFVSPNNRFEDLLPAMNRRPQEKYLMVLSDVHNDDQINMFAKHKIQVQPAIMYRTVSIDWDPAEPFDYDLVALFTPTGVASLQKNFPNFKQGKTIFAALGASTVQALKDANFRVDISVPSERYQSITAAIQGYLEEHNTK